MAKFRTSLYLSKETLNELERIRHAYSLRSISQAVETLVRCKGQLNENTEQYIGESILKMFGITPGTKFYDMLQERGRKNAP